MDISEGSPASFCSERNKGPFTLSLSLDFAQDIREKPIMLSLSNHGLSTNGLIIEECFFYYGPINKSEFHSRQEGFL